jgi:hypothetical protein
VLLPSGIALLVAVLGVVPAAGELRAARRGRRSVRVPIVAGGTTVAVFALATAVLLARAATAALGAPRRYAVAVPQAVLQPETLLIVAGGVAIAAGLIRADRTARTAERSGRAVAQSVRAGNVVLVLGGVGLAVLGLVAMTT